MIPWPRQLRVSPRQVVAALSLAGFLAATVGLPVINPWISPLGKDLSRPFPCQNSACCCQSAEACWRGCCCLTVHSALARLLPYVEQENLQRLVDFNQPVNHASNQAASQTPVKLLVCPSDGSGGRVPGSLHAGTTYAVNNGSGTVDFGLIASGDGLFTQSSLGFRDVIDGLSNTAAISETIIGSGVTTTGTTPADFRREILLVPGGSDPTPAACNAGAGVWSGQRGAKWIDGHYGNTIYNHCYAPNPKTWDCGNAPGNKGLATARSRHPGGVSVLVCDGSVRFVSETIRLDAWRRGPAARWLPNSLD